MRYTVHGDLVHGGDVGEKPKQIGGLGSKCELEKRGVKVLVLNTEGYQG